MKCFHCDSLVKKSELTYIDRYDRYVCDSCVDEYYRWCEDCEEYELEENSFYIDNQDKYVCESCYYDNYTQCYNCGTRLHNDDTYDIDGEPHCLSCYEDNYGEDDGDEDDSRKFKYHSDNGRGWKADEYRYRIGFELEREDDSVLDSIEKYELLDDTGWVIEADASLNWRDGFEAISPVYSLRIKELEREFKKEDLFKIANADFSSSCGGHITISDTKRTPDQIIDDIAGYLPILYALFPNRTENHYCMTMSKDGYKTYAHTHNALSKRGNFTGNGLEIRLFDSPNGYDDLMNRIRLVKYMLQHKASTVEEALKELSDSTKLRKIIKYHLNTKEIGYKSFYSNLIDYSRNLADIMLRIRPEELEEVLNK